MPGHWMWNLWYQSSSGKECFCTILPTIHTNSFTYYRSYINWTTNNVVKGTHKYKNIAEHKGNQVMEGLHLNTIYAIIPTFFAFLQYFASRSLTVTGTQEWFLWVGKWKSIRLSHKNTGSRYCVGFVKVTLTTITAQRVTIHCLAFRRTWFRYSDSRSSVVLDKNSSNVF